MLFHKIAYLFAGEKLTSYPITTLENHPQNQYYCTYRIQKSIIIWDFKFSVITAILF